MTPAPLWEQHKSCWYKNKMIHYIFIRSKAGDWSGLWTTINNRHCLSWSVARASLMSGALETHGTMQCYTNWGVINYCLLIFYKYLDYCNNLLWEITLDSLLDIIWLEVPLDVDDSNVDQSEEEDPAPETSTPSNYGLHRGGANIYTYCFCLTLTSGVAQRLVRTRLSLSERLLFPRLLARLELGVKPSVLHCLMDNRTGRSSRGNSVPAISQLSLDWDSPWSAWTGEGQGKSPKIYFPVNVF